MPNFVGSLNVLPSNFSANFTNSNFTAHANDSLITVGTNVFGNNVVSALNSVGLSLSLFRDLYSTWPYILM